MKIISPPSLVKQAGSLLFERATPAALLCLEPGGRWYLAGGWMEGEALGGGPFSSRRTVGREGPVYAHA